MARDPIAAMDFMGVGKGARQGDTEATAQSDQATLLRPTPTFLCFNERTYWPSNLSVPEGSRHNPSGQLSNMLPQGAPAAFSRPPVGGFVKGNDWASSEVRRNVPAEGIPFKRYVISETLHSTRTLEELVHSDATQLTREGNQCYPSKKFKQGMMHPWNETQTLQQPLFRKDLFDCKGSEEIEHNSQGGASTRHCKRTIVENSSLHLRHVTSLKDLQTANLSGNYRSHMLQLADEASGSAFLDSHKSLSNSELTLSLASAWSKEPKIPEPGVCDPALPASFASFRQFPMSSFGADERKPGKYASPQLPSECEARVSANNSSRPFSAPLTIFYSGQVTIYDDVSLDKAKAIMFLAGSGSLRPSPSNPPLGTGSVAPANSAVSDQCQDLVPPAFMATPLPNAIQQKVQHPHPELPQAKKASLRRFLEKRKERALARVAVIEEIPETDGQPGPCEKSSASRKTPETELYSPVPPPSAQLQAEMSKPPHSSCCEPCSTAKPIQLSEHTADDQGRKEAN